MAESGARGEAIDCFPKRQFFEVDPDQPSESGADEPPVKDETTAPNGDGFQKRFPREITFPVANDIENASSDKAAYEEPRKDKIMNRSRDKTDRAGSAAGNPSAGDESESDQQPERMKLEAPNFEEDGLHRSAVLASG